MFVVLQSQVTFICYLQYNARESFKANLGILPKRELRTSTGLLT